MTRAHLRFPVTRATPCSCTTSLLLPRSQTEQAMTCVLQGADGLAYSTHARTLNEATVEDMKDYIDLVVPAPQSDTAAVVLRLKNSLLNTVFFYDFLLGPKGRVRWTGLEKIWGRSVRRCSWASFLPGTWDSGSWSGRPAPTERSEGSGK